MTFRKKKPYKVTLIFRQITIFLIVCSYHVTYAFQSESRLYSCLNVKGLLARNRHEIWSLSDCNGTQTHNHLACKRNINGWVFIYELSGCGFKFHCSHLVFIMDQKIKNYTKTCFKKSEVIYKTIYDNFSGDMEIVSFDAKGFCCK